MPWRTDSKKYQSGSSDSRRQTPPPGLKAMGHSFFRLIEQEGNDGVSANVAGDVFLGVVGPHLLLVDVLLEDVAKDVRVDFLVVVEWPVVQVPLVGIEEIEYPPERLIRDMDVLVIPFQIVHLEEAAVQIGNPTQQVG